VGKQSETQIQNQVGLELVLWSRLLDLASTTHEARMMERASSRG
jgi:hypothetical protein